MNARTDAPVRSRGIWLAFAVGAIAVAALALTSGGATPDVAKIAVPHELALKTAKLGIAAPAAQAAPAAVGIGYLPAHLAAQGGHDEVHPPQF
jgi:hypothetical protein